jgi:hypothetical protein
MMKHIVHLVQQEERPFTFHDFLSFEVDGIQYCMSKETFRNKVSALVRKEVVEVAYYSSMAFYTLKDFKYTKKTADHTGGTGGTKGTLSSICTPEDLRRIRNHPVYRVIQNTPFDTCALHDIRLRSSVNGIWQLFKNNSSLSINPVSNDISILFDDSEHLITRLTVHRTDTISVVIGCSYSPVVVDIHGLIRLSNVLTLVEDRLQRMINDCDANSTLVVPDHMTWTVTMWHFGADSSILYKGDSFHVSWKVAENALIALYRKAWKDNKYRIRAERQEYPNIPWNDAFHEKLKLKERGRD